MRRSIHLLLSLLAALFLYGWPVLAQNSTNTWQQPMPPYRLVGMEVRVTFDENSACQALIVNSKKEPCDQLARFIKEAYSKNGIMIFDDSSQWIPY